MIRKKYATVSDPPIFKYYTSKIKTSLGAKEVVLCQIFSIKRYFWKDKYKLSETFPTKMTVHAKRKPDMIRDLVGFLGTRELTETPGEDRGVTTCTLQINGIMEGDLGPQECSASIK